MAKSEFAVTEKSILILWVYYITDDRRCQYVERFLLCIRLRFKDSVGCKQKFAGVVQDGFIRQFDRKRDLADFTRAGIPACVGPASVV